jgi:hypothetical protein
MPMNKELEMIGLEIRSSMRRRILLKIKKS